MLAYYGGNVYSATPLGIYNGVLTVVVGVFTADMVIKSWTVAINPDYYLDYVKNKTETPPAAVTATGENEGDHA